MFFLTGLTGFALHMITFNKGVSTLSSATSSILLACAPIFTSILSVAFLKEKINFYCWISIFISFSGILILTLWEGVLSFNEVASNVQIQAIGSLQLEEDTEEKGSA